MEKEGFKQSHAAGCHRPSPAHGQLIFFTVRISLLLAGLMLAGGAGPMRAASPASPVIDRVSPLGLSPGKSMAITLTGNNLDKVTALWTTFPSDATKIDTKSGAGQVSFLVTVPPSVPAAVG